MKKYKDKKSSGCAMCKPWKHGWGDKLKIRDRMKWDLMSKEGR